MSGDNGAQQHPGELQPLAGIATIDVQCCFACGEQHLGLECKPYSKPNPPFTHWFYCPTHKDPVGAAIFQSNNITSELHRKALQNIFKWQGKPCIFITVGQDGDNIEVSAIREGYPTARLPEAASNILTAIERLAPKPDDSPLPPASDEFLARLGVRRAAARSANQLYGPVSVPTAEDLAAQDRNQQIADDLDRARLAKKE